MTKPVKPSKTRSSRKTPAKTPALPALRPQVHGGMLQSGNPGNEGGPGRPASAIRAHLRGSFDERLPVLERIADGEALQKAEIPLWRILEYAKCPKCDIALEAKDSANLVLTTIEGRVSASPRDRMVAMKLMGELGLEQEKVTADVVRAKIDAMLKVLRDRLGLEQFNAILPEIREAFFSV